MFPCVNEKLHLNDKQHAWRDAQVMQPSNDVRKTREDDNQKRNRGKVTEWQHKEQTTHQSINYQTFLDEKD